MREYQQNINLEGLFNGERKVAPEAMTLCLENTAGEITKKVITIKDGLTTHIVFSEDYAAIWNPQDEGWIGVKRDEAGFTGPYDLPDSWLKLLKVMYRYPVMGDSREIAKLSPEKLYGYEINQGYSESMQEFDTNELNKEIHMTKKEYNMWRK